MASIIIKWKKFEQPIAGRPAKLSNQRKYLVTKNLMVTLVKLVEIMCGDERKPSEGQPSLQCSTDLGFMAELPDGSLSLSKRRMKACLEFAKSLKDSPTERNNIFWSDETKIGTV